MRNTRRGLGGILALCLGLTACLVPPFSSLQDARMVGSGKVEVTPFYSSIGAVGEASQQHIQDNFGLQAEFGLSAKADLMFRYEYMKLAPMEYADGEAVHVLALGPKFRLSDNSAFALPIGMAFGDGVDPFCTAEAQPTLLFTIPAGKALDFNLAAKVLVPIADPAGTLLAADLGLGLRPFGSGVTLRPEVGLLVSPQGGGADFHCSLGLSFRFTK